MPEDKIKNDENLQYLPVIILSARQNSEVRIEAFNIGADDYITKPFKEDELLARVDNLIANGKKRAPKASNITAKMKKKGNPSAGDLKWLEKVKDNILAKIDQPELKLKDIAEEMDVPYSSFVNKIKKCTGLTPKQYERSLKLSKARELLKAENTKTVSEVMYQLGFDNHYYFSKMYKEEFGIMPSEEL